jgi:hypothetical protein
MESPLSAFLWRTGIITLLWHGSAFRLPFLQHFYMQSIAAMAYALFLAEDVCTSLNSTQHGVWTVTAAQRILQAGRVVWDLASFVVSGNEALLFADTPTSGPHPDPSAMPVQSLTTNTLGGLASCNSSSSSSDGLALLQQQACVHAVRWWQVLLGHVLLSAVLYCLEVKDRRRWLHKTYGHLPARSDSQQQLQEQQQQQHAQDQQQ